MIITMFRRKLANFLSIGNEFLCQTVCLILHCPQYHLLRLQFWRQQCPEPYYHQVSEKKKNEKLSGIPFLLIDYCFTVLSINFACICLGLYHDVLFRRTLITFKSNESTTYSWYPWIYTAIKISVVSKFLCLIVIRRLYYSFRSPLRASSS